jgi:hypothetical protein
MKVSMTVIEGSKIEIKKGLMVVAFTTTWD